jgi:hypothetical protein
MVWALQWPSSFGKYWPDGDFIGYDGQLEQVFNFEKDEFKAMFGNRFATYARFVSMKWFLEPGTILDKLPALNSLESHEKPSNFRTLRKHKTLGSIVSSAYQLKLVDQDFKAILERLDPNVHTFWPVTVTFPNGVVFPKQYYGIAIGRFLDSFMPEKTVGDPWSIPTSFSKDEVGRFVFSSGAIGSAHLWRERRLRVADWYFSNELKAEIDKYGLALPRHFQGRET